jgi:hypothetical protein
MAKTGITFHNQATIKVLAQIFTGHTLVSTCLAGPGESCIIPVQPARYDIFLKNGATGWEIAHKMDSADKTITLRQQKGGRYTMTGD